MVYYTGGSHPDWIIGDNYVFANYGGFDDWYEHRKDWPDRLLGENWPIATQKQIRELIVTIFNAKSIEVNPR